MIPYSLLSTCLLVIFSTDALAEPGATVKVSNWPSPNIPIFGTATNDTICVYVLGEVHRPGAYYIPRDSKLLQAVESAQGVTRLAWWLPAYSAIVRQSFASPPRIIPFTKDRKKDEEMQLKDGDQIYFGHEVY